MGKSEAALPTGPPIRVRIGSQLVSTMALVRWNAEHAALTRHDALGRELVSDFQIETTYTCLGFDFIADEMPLFALNIEVTAAMLFCGRNAMHDRPSKYDLR